APQNAAIMETIYGPVVEQLTAQLPPGADLADEATRGAVVDGIVESFDGGLPSGDGSVGTSLNGDTSFLNTADPALAAPFLDGFANATVTLFWLAASVVAVAFVLSFLLRAQPLRDKSAVQEAHEERLARTREEASDELADALAM